VLQLVENGVDRYLPDTLLLFKALARYPDVALAVVHSRRPNIEEFDLSALLPPRHAEAWAVPREATVASVDLQHLVHAG
jgi:hypothetical protein